jgi:anti-sigma factor ChrR (cupin superfamily)
MDFTASEHPDEETLEKYLLGALDRNAAIPIDEHLLVCQVCIENARKLDDYIKAMRKELKADPKKAKAAKKGKT